MSAVRDVTEQSPGGPRFEAIPYLIDERTGTYFDKRRMEYRVLAFKEPDDDPILLGTFSAELPLEARRQAERSMWERFIFDSAPQPRSDR